MQKQYGAVNYIDFPHMMIYSLPTPFYIDQEIDHAQMEATIIAGAKKLESTGVNFIAMPCNTAHAYFENIQNALSVPLLNMIEITAEKIGAETKRVTLLATETTIASGLYQNAISAEVVLKDSWQMQVNALIQGVKSGKAESELMGMVKELSESLKEENIDTVVVACTDISNIAKQLQGFTVIDSSQSLAENTVRTYLQ